MKIGSILAALIGLGIAGVLIALAGLGPIGHLLARARFGIALVVLFHLTQLAASARAWQAIATDGRGFPPFGAFLLIRAVREGVNNLLPVAQIGGEVVGARLVHRRGVTLAVAGAGVVCDLTVEMLTEIGFVLLGLALLLDTTAAAGLLRPVMTACAGAVLLAALFVAAQFLGLARLLERVLLRLASRFGWHGLEGVVGLEAALRRLWSRSRSLARAVGWHSLSWLLGGPEVWLALAVLTGHAPSLAACFVIESLGQALKNVGFAIPGAIGVQEGGYVLVCHLYGIPADAAIALSLLKRLREIVLGAPSLLLWRWLERRPVATPRARAIAGSSA